MEKQRYRFRQGKRSREAGKQGSREAGKQGSRKGKGCESRLQFLYTYVCKYVCSASQSVSLRTTAPGFALFSLMYTLTGQCLCIIYAVHQPWKSRLFAQMVACFQPSRDECACHLLITFQLSTNPLRIFKLGEPPLIQLDELRETFCNAHHLFLYHPIPYPRLLRINFFKCRITAGTRNYFFRFSYFGITFTARISRSNCIESQKSFESSPCFLGFCPNERLPFTGCAIRMRCTYYSLITRKSMCRAKKMRRNKMLSKNEL